MLKWFKRRSKENTSYSSTDEWVEALSSPVEEQAVAQLREQLIEGLKPALHSYVDHDLDQFVEDVAQDALLKVLNNIDSFRGDSELITWAMKIAVREGLSELRLKKYDDSHIEEFRNPNGEGRNELSSLTFSADLPNPEEATHEQLVLREVLNIINNELTDKQRKAIRALMIEGLPVTVVAKKMKTNRNALYKLVHDARMKIKDRLVSRGIDPKKIFNKI